MATTNIPSGREEEHRGNESTTTSLARRAIPRACEACLAHLHFDVEKAQALKTLYTQKMLENGYLACGAFYASWAHQESTVNSFLQVVAKVFGELNQALESDTVEKQLDGPPAHDGFRRLN